MSQTEPPADLSVEELPEIEDIPLNELIHAWLEREGYEPSIEHDDFVEWLRIGEVTVSQEGVDTTFKQWTAMAHVSVDSDSTRIVRDKR